MRQHRSSGDGKAPRATIRPVSPDALDSSAVDEPTVVRPLPIVGLGAGVAVRAAVGAVVFVLAFRHGAFAVSDWSTAGLLVWWSVLLGLIVGVWRLELAPRAAWAAAALLSLFAVWTGVSALWAGDPGTAATDGFQAAVYAGVFVLALVAPRPASAAQWGDGVAAAILVVVALALVSRVFPGHLAGVPNVVAPGAETRLQYPVGYWNGLAIFAALACPLLLRIAVRAGRPWARGLALAPFAPIAAVVYFASSRTGAVTAVLGCVLFVAASTRRWAAALAATIGTGTGIAAIAYIHTLHTLVDGPLISPAAVSEGRHAVIAIAGCAAAATIVYAAWAPYADAPRLPRGAGAATLGLLAVVVAVIVVVAHPVRQWDTFTRVPTAAKTASSHFLSTSGNWRWQYWTSAVHEFATHPLAGRGAGMFEPWWARHGSVSGFVQNAHSLYFETLGDLGLIGLVIVVAALVGGAIVALLRTKRLAGALRDDAAAVAAGAGAFAVAAGLDWMWTLPCVAMTGVLLLGLALGPASSPRGPARAGRLIPRIRAYEAAVGAAALIALACLADAYASNTTLAASQNAAARADYRTAAREARTLRRIEPWSSEPYLQLALVQEQQGQLLPAERSIRSAIARDVEDWRPWLAYARIETKLGRIRSARAALHHAAALNPRSPVFVDVTPAKL